MNLDTIILCGGLGTRLKPVSGDVPKVLADVAGRPFINLLIDSLAKFGLSNFILCTGYGREQLRSHFRDSHHKISFSEETSLLGTGGALKNAKPFITSPHFLLLNGDSYCAVDYAELIKFHLQKRGIMTLVLSQPDAGEDYGAVAIDETNRITHFKEKSKLEEKMLINAGIYLFERRIFQYMPAVDKFSLEYDFFPDLLDLECYGFLTKGKLIDIGTPERYRKAQQYFANGRFNLT